MNKFNLGLTTYCFTIENTVKLAKLAAFKANIHKNGLDIVRVLGLPHCAIMFFVIY